MNVYLLKTRNTGIRSIMYSIKIMYQYLEGVFGSKSICAYLEKEKMTTR